MIRVDKGTVIPKKLTDQGDASNIANRKIYDDNKAGCLDGSIPITILNNIYGNRPLKKIIKAKQFGKCCFCEKDQEDEHGHIEHYRPKHGYKASENGVLMKPGYYWLGYTWSNLYFVCFGCNSVEFKGNNFPLSDEGLRARSHYDNVDNEDALILDPGGVKNPRDHIYFDRHLPRWKSIEGETTVKLCGLDRDALNNKRNKLIGDIDARLVILEHYDVNNVAKFDDAKLFIKNSVRKDMEFSAAAYDYLNPLSDYLLGFGIVLNPLLTSDQP